MTYNNLQGTFTTMIGFVTWPPLLYVIQVKEFLIKCLTSWPYLISEFLVAYITIVASDWPRTFFTPKVFLFSIFILRMLNFVTQLIYKCMENKTNFLI